MNERLLKQWQITERLLRSAAQELATHTAHATVAEYIDHNEFELALDELESAGTESRVSPEFWWNLKKAAEVMGLRDRYAALREKRRVAILEQKAGKPPSSTHE